MISKGCLVRSLINNFGGINVGDVYLVVSDIYTIASDERPVVNVLSNGKSRTMQVRYIEKVQ